MADLKSMFKAARDQRGTQTSVKKLTKEQIRELRAKQAAETVQKERAAAAKAAAMQQAAKAAAASAAPAPAKPSGSMPPPAPRAPKPAWAAAAPAASPAAARTMMAPPAPVPVATTHAANLAQGPGPDDAMAASTAASPQEPPASASHLPADFFQVRQDAEDSAVPSDPMSRQPPGVSSGRATQGSVAASAAPAAGPGPAPQGALPKGFFEDKEKDAKARGVAPPKKKDPNEEFKQFMESIEVDVQEAEDVAAEEAAEEAIDRDELEDYEQRQRVQRITKIAEGKDRPEDRLPFLESSPPDTAGPAGKKRRRPADVLNSDSEEDDDLQEPSLDWRARNF